MTTAMLGLKIRETRKGKNLTLKQMADLCNVGVRFLSELENGKETIELGKVLTVLKRLNLEILLMSRADFQKEFLHLNSLIHG